MMSGSYHILYGASLFAPLLAHSCLVGLRWGRVTFRASGERCATILKAFGAIIHTVGSQIQTWI